MVDLALDMHQHHFILWIIFVRQGQRPEDKSIDILFAIFSLSWDIIKLEMNRFSEKHSHCFLIIAFRLLNIFAETIIHM